MLNLGLVRRTGCLYELMNGEETKVDKPIVEQHSVTTGPVEPEQRGERYVIEILLLCKHRKSGNRN